jgi:hypothetical protein
LVDRFHRYLKGALRARAAVAADWHDHLPWVMLGVFVLLAAKTVAAFCR